MEGEVSKSVLTKPNDMVIQSIMIEESYFMSGVPAKLVLADYIVPEVGFAPDITYTDEVSTHIMMDHAPTPKLLKQLGWNIESDNNTHPMIASVPRYLSKGTINTGIIDPTSYYELKVNKYTKVYLDYDYDLPDRVFIVTDVTSNMFNPVFYYMKLVPFHDRIDEDPTPVNDPNLSHINKEGGFKHIQMPGKRCPNGVTVEY